MSRTYHSARRARKGEPARFSTPYTQGRRSRWKRIERKTALAKMRHEARLDLQALRALKVPND